MLTLALALPPAAPADPAAWRGQWPLTDFARADVPFGEIVPGGPGRDGIPALDAPAFVPVREKAGLGAREPVIALELGGAARAYPIRYLMWHEIVNDTVGGVPVAVTFCPLCNSAITFDRRAGGRVLSFGVTGLLRHSDMVMYDRETESWWQQALGRGIVGRMAGVELRQLASWTEPWSAFAARRPDGLVMAEPDWPRAYGRNPYAGYDGLSRPFLYAGDLPPHGIEPLARVVRVGERAWPMERLRREGRVAEGGVVIEWTAGMASALDSASIAAGRDIGHIRVRDGRGRDLPHDPMFAFAFHALFPGGEWMLGG